MTERLHKLDLLRSIKTLSEMVGAEDWQLETWSPGDGKTRYRIEDSKGNKPLGQDYSLGILAMYDRVWSCIQFYRYLSEEPNDIRTVLKIKYG